MNKKSLFLPITIIFLFYQLFVSDAYAYLDPGTGSMIIQSLVGVFIAIGIALKVYWTKIKYAFSERKSTKK